MDYSYLNNVLLLFFATVITVVLCLRFGLPPILGYLIVGVSMGPSGFNLIDETEHTLAFAEFGVVFLLFTIGLEFSVPLLLRMKAAVLGLGGSQVMISTVLVSIIAMLSGLPLESAVVLGGIIAMSSTALVIKQLTDQVELHTRHGRNAVGILLFQDVMVIPFLILITLVSSDSSVNPAFAIISAFIEGLAALILIFGFGRWILKPLFRAVATFKSMELFTLTALLVALGAAWITSQMGLSLALGAFIAGMMLGGTEFRHQVEAEIRPFRDILLGLFFITVGMLLDIHQLPDVWGWVIFLSIALIISKTVLVWGICKLSGWDSAVSMRTGLILAHGGEFGFAILALALNAHTINHDLGQIILAALLLSMGIAPLIIRYNGVMTKLALPNVLSQSLNKIRDQVTEAAQELNNHIIICGYGRVGKTISHFLEGEQVRFIALDLDPKIVKEGLDNNEPVTYGDASNIHLLNAAGLDRAAVLVVTIDDVNASIKIIHKVRHNCPDTPILVRTRDDSQMETLQEAGATQVIPETLEASLMISSQILLMLHVPPSIVLRKFRRERDSRYKLLRRHIDNHKNENHNE
ncbi:MAG: cation:proton antiporter [Gammaproteobacteria bacterium]